MKINNDPVSFMGGLFKMNCVQSNFAHSEFRLIGIRLGLWGKFVKGGK